MLSVQTLPLNTVVLRVMLHCEGCAHTVKRACKNIPGRNLSTSFSSFQTVVSSDSEFLIGVETPAEESCSRVDRVLILQQGSHRIRWTFPDSSLP